MIKARSGVDPGAPPLSPDDFVGGPFGPHRGSAHWRPAPRSHVARRARDISHRVFAIVTPAPRRAPEEK